MIPWERIDSAQVPATDRLLCLYRRRDEFSIRLDRFELMNSRIHGSEEALAVHACERLRRCPRPRVLIAGLGMGFTTAAALGCLAPAGRVVVAELVPAVVTWNRKYYGHLAGHPLRDARVTVREIDAARIIKTEPKAYDAILLDVDNGPQGLTRKANDWFYTSAGLEAAYDALRSAGILAVWSAAPDELFARRLSHTGFQVTQVPARARGPHGGGRHMIWVAQRGL
jgi:spermidine synthase